MQKLSKLILRMAGWKAYATVAEPQKSVICVAPHTSNWDFPIGKLAYVSLGRKASFLIKDSWFFFPMGYLLRPWVVFRWTEQRKIRSLCKWLTNFQKEIHSIWL